VLILKRLVVWLIETSCEALLLGAVLIVSSMSYGPSQSGFAKDLLFSAWATAFVFMWGTGYVVTTLLFRVFLRGQRLWLYPAVAAVLFLTHLQILFFIATGWPSSQRIQVRAAGVCIVFACTFAGSFVLQKWGAAKP
jgi:hypothetical protein